MQLSHNAMFDRVRQFAKTAAVSLLGGVFGAALVWILAKSATITASDILQAGSAFAGVAITIWGTLWLEGQKRKRNQHEEQRLLREGLGMLAAHIVFTLEEFPPDSTLADRRMRVAGQYELLRDSRSAISYAREGYRIKDYNLWSALQALETEFTAASQIIDREERILRGGNVTQQVLDISRREVLQIAGDFQQPVRAALDALERAAASHQAM